MADPTPAVAAPAAAPAAVPPAAAAPAAAPATPAAPAAPAASPAPAPADPGDSLIPADPAPPATAPQTDAEKLAAARALVEAADRAAQPNGKNPDGTQASWLLADGVMGQGGKPEWFRNDKYKDVSAQAKAYTELEKRFGSFTGAPKNEKGEVAYTFTPPEGIEVSMDHPVMQAFNKWAGDKQLSQDGYNELLGMLVQYEASQAPDMGAIKASLGDNADSRISNASAWVKANLGADGFADFRAATNGANAAAVFKLVEGLIGKSGTVRMPTPGTDVAPAAGRGLADIQAKFGEKLADGRLRINVEPKRLAELNKELADYFASMPAGYEYHGSRTT